MLKKVEKIQFELSQGFKIISVLFKLLCRYFAIFVVCAFLSRGIICCENNQFFNAENVVSFIVMINDHYQVMIIINGHNQSLRLLF